MPDLEKLLPVIAIIVGLPAMAVALRDLARWRRFSAKVSLDNFGTIGVAVTNRMSSELTLGAAGLFFYRSPFWRAVDVVARIRTGRSAQMVRVRWDEPIPRSFAANGTQRVFGQLQVPADSRHVLRGRLDIGGRILFTPVNRTGDRAIMRDSDSVG